MKESYREGVASHPGPQPCEGGREAALEALERGIRRQGIELRNQLIPAESEAAGHLPGPSVEGEQWIPHCSAGLGTVAKQAAEKPLGGG